MLKKLLLLVLLSSPAFAEPERSCDITIEFGSYATGIDAGTYELIMDRILQTPEITEKHVMNIGDEGERSLCLTLGENADIDKVYEDLESLIPQESKTGWEKITSRTGREFQTRWSRQFTPYTWDRD